VTVSPIFPENFAWGTASASYQIEGGVHAGGRGSSIWDDFSHSPGRTFGGHTGDVACDHFHRWPEDVALMRALGVKHYRLSLAWTRLLPEGTGAVNQAGVDFYRRILDALKTAGIEPWITLNHWDYPSALQMRGGWLNPDSVGWMADYAAVCARQFGDAVTNWMPINEPQCVVILGYQTGEHAPGWKLPRNAILQAMHHTHVATAKSAVAIRASSPRKALIGAALAADQLIPASDSPADIAACERAMWTIDPERVWSNPHWADPLLAGKYDDAAMAVFGADQPRRRAGDDEALAGAKLDFCGINCYSARVIAAGPAGPVVVPPAPGFVTTTQNNWHVTPAMMRWCPRWWNRRYHLPVVITENGHQNLDHVALDGHVHDPQRVDYLHRYLAELGRGIAEGNDVRGYFCWTLMDNFEWALGYNVRVGLVHVDFQTLKRTPKDSFGWYREVVRSNGASLAPPAALQARS
jgi:beta-glucosidase